MDHSGSNTSKSMKRQMELRVLSDIMRPSMLYIRSCLIIYPENYIGKLAWKQPKLTREEKITKLAMNI